MRHLVIGMAIGLAGAVGLSASLNTELFKVPQAKAQTANPANSSQCSSSASSQIITQVVSSVPGKVLGFFVCVADLDGTGKQEVVVGRYAEGGGTMSIFTNAGNLRKQVAW